jgi:drug/metabolite transporter (DMT)-like permease
MVAVGVAVALVAAVAGAFAVVLQAEEARALADGEPLLKTLLRHRRWLLGAALMALAWPLQVLALAFAPIAVVQAMLATSQLALLALARTRLGERVGRAQALATGAIVLGLVAVVGEAPRHSTFAGSAGRLAPPLVVVGALALAGALRARGGARSGARLVLAAGLAYAWADFGNQLLSDAAAKGHWGHAALWLAAVVVFGALAFFEENAALRDRPAITVAPVIAAVQGPLPVVMALAAGIEGWGTSPLRIVALAVGLGLVVSGATTLARSPIVAAVVQGESLSMTQPPPGSGV